MEGYSKSPTLETWVMEPTGEAAVMDPASDAGVAESASSLRAASSAAAEFLATLLWAGLYSEARRWIVRIWLSESRSHGGDSRMRAESSETMTSVRPMKRLIVPTGRIMLCVAARQDLEHLADRYHAAGRDRLVDGQIGSRRRTPSRPHGGRHCCGNGHGRCCNRQRVVERGARAASHLRCEMRATTQGFTQVRPPGG